jgi:hypothetical protein
MVMIWDHLFKKFLLDIQLKNLLRSSLLDAVNAGVPLNQSVDHFHSLILALTKVSFVQGDHKVSVHMITIQKVTSNVQSFPRQSPDIY